MIHICTKQKYVSKKKKKGLLSHTPHLLSEALGAYLRTAEHLPLTTGLHLVNWGCTAVVGLHNYNRVLNQPCYVRNSSDKTLTHRLLKGAMVPTLDYTTDIEVAKLWMSFCKDEEDEPEKHGWVVCRTLTRSSSGKGIVIAKEEDEIVPAPLYTMYFRKKYEYRYHVFNGKVIDIQQKKRLSSEELSARGFLFRPLSYVRNLANGYIFAREEVQYHIELGDMAIRAVRAVGLDFGAVDILCNEDGFGNYEDGVVCEVNSAPGLTGTTFDLYKEALEEWQDGL